MKEGRIYSGGSASMVETLFNVNADEVMYVGDHIFTDVNIAKEYMRWRTALIVKEFEEEVLAIDRGKQHTEEVRNGGLGFGGFRVQTEGSSTPRG